MNRTTGSEWEGRLGSKWADEWRRTDRSFGMVTERLLARSRDFSFSKALDIGCGAGELSLALARGRHQAEVLGVDISQDLLSAAEHRASNLTNVTFTVGDAQTWQPPADFVPELLISRHGVMFFADPPAAFANLHAISSPDAHLLFSCFRDRKANGWMRELASLLPAPAGGPPDPYAPGPFAFGDPEHTRGILEAGGWTGVEFEPVDYGMVVGSGEEPLSDAVSYFISIGPAAAAAREMDEAEEALFAERLRTMLESHLNEGIVALSAAAWIVTANKR